MGRIDVLHGNRLAPYREGAVLQFKLEPYPPDTLRHSVGLSSPDPTLVALIQLLATPITGHETSLSRPQRQTKASKVHTLFNVPSWEKIHWGWSAISVLRS